MKAILIARVSTEEQREAGNSLPAQVVRLEKYCQSKGFSVMQICSFDESAYTNNRSEFDRIIDLILEQKEKVVVCCDKVDRLSRNVFDKRISLLYERALNDDIELHFVSESQIINSRISAVEKFQFSISLGLAKYYSDAISDNVKRAMEQKLRKGEFPSKAPFGYKNIRNADDTTNIIIDQDASYIVIKAFELYASQAYSLELLCDKFKKDYGLSWKKGHLAHVLNNCFYHGEMLVKGKIYPHRYPPIISKELYVTVQQIKDGFNKKPFKYAGKPYIYRGLIRCGDCGLSITPEKHKGFVYYHCTQYKGKHGGKWLREETITEQIGLVFKNLQMPPEIMDQIVETLNAVHQDKIDFHNREFDKLTKEQKTITKMMDNLYLDKLKGSITDEEYDRFYHTFQDQASNISIALDQLQDAENNYYITAKYVLNLTNRAYELFVSSEVEERRQLIKLVLSNLRLEGENIVYEALSPFNLILNSTDSNIWRS
ncbi:MAG: recombinase family protein [Candidatus Babeliales bacterium]|nr:recombinase family protein [Candidatus Babeliales bacterium]